MNKVPPNNQPKLIFDVPSDEEIRWILNRENPDNPFHDFVGNDGVVNKIHRLAFAALKREDHNASDIRLAFLGPAGVGKTTVAKKVSEILDIPFVNVDPGSLSNSHDLFLLIARSAESMGLSNGDGTYKTLALLPQKHPQYEQAYIAPPMVVIIDEAHNVPKDVEQSLLTATDENVNELVTCEGTYLNTSQILWIIGTTEAGKLFHAFKTRFTEVQFQNYSPEEVSSIVQKNTGLELDVCKKIAYFCNKVTRKAIGFAKEVTMERNMVGGSWDDAIEVIRKEHRIDEFGMELRQVNVLKALEFQGKMSKARLASLAGCRVEELQNEIMPPLLEFSDNKVPLVGILSTGFHITEAGRQELIKRGIELGEKVK